MNFPSLIVSLIFLLYAILQVLALILGSLQHLHTTSALPLYTSFLATMQRALHHAAHTARTLPKLQTVDEAQLCRVVVLLQRANCVEVCGGPHLDAPLTIRLSGLRGLLDLRRRHDGYLEGLMSSSGASVTDLQDLLWPVESAEQTRLQAEVELVVSEVRRVLLL